MKNRFKSISIMAASAVLIAGQCISAFAYNTNKLLGSTEIVKETTKNGFEIHKAGGKKGTFPGWYWVDQYCYYWTDPYNYAKSTTTPDGYEVDAEGRWSINGVPQTNDYGHQVISTDTLYAGKSDDERWAIMKDLLEKNFAENYAADETSYAMQSSTNTVNGFYDLNFGSSSDRVIHDSGNGEYILAHLEKGWNDGWNYCNGVLNYNISYVTERNLKILLGDHVGQELFNDIKAAADPLSGQPKEVPKYDSNGEAILHKDPVLLTYTCEMITIPNSGDGINSNLFDSSKWQNRTTDYGKKFSVEITPDTNESMGTFEIKIQK